MANLFKRISIKSRRYVSPAFITMLIISACLWLLINLGKTYQAPIPVAIDVENNQFKVECMVEGTGYRILAHRFFKRHSPIRLTTNDIQVYPSVFNEGWYSISAHSLQTAISLRTSDVSVRSVEGIPEIQLNED